MDTFQNRAGILSWWAWLLRWWLTVFAVGVGAYAGGLLFSSMYQVGAASAGGAGVRC